MNYPLVSVIVNFYKEKKHQVIRTINSVLNQTYPNIEIIIILDSPDSDYIIECLKDFQYNHKNIRLKINETNVGISKSRNIGIDLSNGKYIAFFDGDDESLPNRIEYQVEYMENNPTIDISGTGVIWMDELNPKSSFNAIPPKNINKTFKRYCPVAQPSMIAKKDSFLIYGKYNIDLRKAQDYEFMINWWIKGANFGNILDCLVIYYRDTSGENTQIRRETINGLKIRFKYINQLDLNLFDILRIFFYEIPFFVLLPRKLVNKLVFFVNKYIRKK